MTLAKLGLLTGILIVLTVLVSGVFAIGFVQRPEVGILDMGDWGQVGNNSIEIRSTGYVYNPSSFRLNSSSLSIVYRLRMNGVVLAEGRKEGLNIEENSNQTVSVISFLKRDKVSDWWVKHVNNEEKSRFEVPVSVNLDLYSYPIKLGEHTYSDTVETNLESKIEHTVSNIEGDYSWSLTGTDFTETRINILDSSAKFGKVTADRTNLLVILKIRNPNSYPIPTPRLTGGLSMNGVNVANWNENNVEVINYPSTDRIPPGEVRTIRVNATIDNYMLDKWFIRHAANNERTSGNINLKFVFNIADQQVELPSSKGINCGFNFQTGILVDNQGSSSDLSNCEFTGRISSVVENGSGNYDFLSEEYGGQNQ